MMIAKAVREVNRKKKEIWKRKNKPQEKKADLRSLW